MIENLSSVNFAKAFMLSCLFMRRTCVDLTHLENKLKIDESVAELTHRDDDLSVNDVTSIDGAINTIRMHHHGFC